MAGDARRTLNEYFMPVDSISNLAGANSSGAFVVTETGELVALTYHTEGNVDVDTVLTVSQNGSATTATFTIDASVATANTGATLTPSEKVVLQEGDAILVTSGGETTIASIVHITFIARR